MSEKCEERINQRAILQQAQNDVFSGRERRNVIDSKVTLGTYDTNGVVQQLSHSSVPDMFSVSDVIGTTVEDWNASLHLANVLFSSSDTCHTDDLHWSNNGQSGISRVLSMRLKTESAVVVASYLPRTWELTDVEQQVMSHLANGATLQETADAMLVGIPAIRSTIVRVRQKTGARSLPHAVALCCWSGVI